MATITFNKTGNLYVAEFTANKDYSLHIEREKTGQLDMHQRYGSKSDGIKEGFSTCILPNYIQFGSWKNLNWSFNHGVYPVNVKLTSSVEIKYCELFDE